MSYAVIILGSRPRGLARTDEDMLPVIFFFSRVFSLQRENDGNEHQPKVCLGVVGVGRVLSANKRNRDLSTSPAKGTLLDLLFDLGSWFQIAETETQQNWIQKATEKMISGC